MEIVKKTRNRDILQKKGYELNEASLLELLQKYYICDLMKTTNLKERWDCTSKKFKMAGELKSRKVAYFDKMIEKEKYEALLERPEKNIRYIVSDPSGIYVHDLRINQDIEQNWLWELCPKTTEFKNNEYVLKEVCYLNGEEGKKLEL